MRQLIPFVAIIVLSCGPPSPTPPPPDTPVDASAVKLNKAVREAYNAETDPDKSNRSKYIASVFMNAGPTVAASASNGDLFGALGKSIHSPDKGFPKGEMKTVMKAVGAHLNEALGESATAKLNRAKAKKALSALANALNAARD